MSDPINPSHYKQGKGTQPIDLIADQDMGYNEGCIIKYVTRYKYKNGLEDLKKAQWYLDRLIKKEES